jgi:(p)ppGpp synthase/HD superfamily hydrolase
MSSEQSRMVWFHPVDVTASLHTRIGEIATAIRARGVVSAHSAPKLPQSVLVCIDVRTANNAAIRRRSLSIVREKLERANRDCFRTSERAYELQTEKRELLRENSRLRKELKARAKELQHYADERNSPDARLTASQMRVAALEQILRNAGLEVPEDPPPEALPRCPRVHLVPGSFENGKRR